jgi:hypothetical protein
MNQQEIKENMTKGEITYVSYANILQIQSSCFYGEPDLLNLEETPNAEANAEAIVHAINNTYGKGINPESVSEMYNTLQGVVLILQMLNERKTAQDIQDILNKAAL